MKKLFLLLAIMAFSACTKKEVSKEEVLRPVRYQEVLASGGVQLKTFSGSARAGIETKLSFKVSGTVQTITVKVGEQIKAGKLISSVDPSDYILQYKEADAAVSRADAEEKNAKSGYERLALLYENQNASLAEFESARTQYESARAFEKSAKQRRKLAKSQLDYTRLCTPLDGIVAEVNVEENENVQLGQSIILLNSGSDIEVTVAIPELYISRIKVGDAVKVAFTAIRDKTHEGVVTEVSFATGRSATTYPVTIKINDPDEGIRPGMAVDVLFTFIYEGSENKMLVSAFSVSEDKDGVFVYVVATGEQDGVGIIQKKPVSVGELTNEGIEITTGLEEGDKVVSAGVSRITAGMKVKLLQ